MAVALPRDIRSPNHPIGLWVQSWRRHSKWLGKPSGGSWLKVQIVW